MLLLEFLPAHNVYLAIPIVDRKPDKEQEFVFGTEEAQLEFVTMYNLNPYAASFAYHVQMNMGEHMDLYCIFPQG